MPQTLCTRSPTKLITRHKSPTSICSSGIGKHRPWYTGVDESDHCVIGWLTTRTYCYGTQDRKKRKRFGSLYLQEIKPRASLTCEFGTMADQKAGTSKPQHPTKPMEDDDEFEEFDVEDWREEDEDPAKAELWEADWDDTSVSDNFSQQLRAELQKHSKK
ncbi:26S proteasome complex subunit SEM1 [Trebouxia sp. C0009 RCD-2024]